MRLLCLVGALVAVTGCKKDVCVPGMSIACVGVAGCAGGQVCMDGMQYGPCNCGGQPDLSSAPSDLAMSDLSLTMTINWTLLTANLMGGINNGFSINCDDPMVGATMIAFTVKSNGGQSTVTTGPCPAGAGSGSQTLQLPDAVGPFTISAVLPNQAMSSSDKIPNLTPTSLVNLRIYALGCDAPSCQ
jgi:hypothetical protein